LALLSALSDPPREYSSDAAATLSRPFDRDDVVVELALEHCTPASVVMMREADNICSI
jgi:hypothetical protein